MLQSARLPRTGQEWGSVGEAVAALAPYLQSNSSPEALLRDLQVFVRNVEQWWAGRKREGSGGLKRGAAPAGLLPPTQPKRLAGDAMLPLPAPEHALLDGGAFLPPGGDAAAAAVVANGGLAVPPLDMDMHRVLSMGNLGDLPNMAALDSLALPTQPNGSVPGGGAGNGWARKVVTLNVGGRVFSTTLSTLTAVEGSYLWKLAQKARAGGSGEYFIDRNGTPFQHVLDYLRCHRYGEDPAQALPEDASTLRLVRREAAFYKLPGLEAAAAHAQAAAAAAPCDAVFLQTGFQEEGPALAQAHADLVRRLNLELAAKAAQGFAPAQRQCGTEVSAEGRRNIWTHVLLVKEAST